MNKRGSSALVMLMIAVVFYVLGLALANPLKEITAQSMNTTELNCSTATTYQDIATCRSIDLFQPFYVGLIFGFAGLIIARIALA